jgi:hypothetical protein
MSAFEHADAIYSCLHTYSVEKVAVEHEGFKQFSLSLGRLQRKIGPEKDDQFWIDALTPLTKLRYRFSSLPLKFSSELNLPEGLHRLFNDLAPRCAHIYPDFHHDLGSLVAQAKTLIESNEAPLLNAMRKCLAEKKSLNPTILSRNWILNSVGVDFKKMLGIPRARIISAHELLHFPVSDLLLVIGPARWFPLHIKTAPRTKQTVIFHYDWMKDNASLQPSLLGVDAALFKPMTSPVEQIKTPVGEMIDADEVLQAVDWDFLNFGNELRSSHVDVTDEVNARLIILNGGVAVYVDVSKAAELMIIDFDKKKGVSRIQSRELDISMHILLRTGKAGNLLLTVADRLLGKRAEEMRKMQRSWKNRLEDLIREKGESKLIEELATFGCKRANYLNIRNWKSEKNIRPEFDEDFFAVLFLCGYGERELDFISNAKQIDHAHRVAGFKIRKMLLERVGQADLEQLKESGRMEFFLPGGEGASFTAYRVEEVSPKEFRVPSTYINSPFRMDFFNG